MGFCLVINKDEMKEGLKEGCSIGRKKQGARNSTMWDGCFLKMKDTMGKRTYTNDQVHKETMLRINWDGFPVALKLTTTAHHRK